MDLVHYPKNYVWLGCLFIYLFIVFCFFVHFSLLSLEALFNEFFSLFYLLFTTPAIHLSTALLKFEGICHANRN